MEQHNAPDVVATYRLRNRTNWKFWADVISRFYSTLVDFGRARNGNNTTISSSLLLDSNITDRRCCGEKDLFFKIFPHIFSVDTYPSI